MLALVTFVLKFIPAPQSSVYPHGERRVVVQDTQSTSSPSRCLCAFTDGVPKSGTQRRESCVGRAAPDRQNDLSALIRTQTYRAAVLHARLPWFWSFSGVQALNAALVNGSTRGSVYTI